MLAYMSHFDDVYRRSLDDPERFWGDAASTVAWDVVPSQILSGTAPFQRWFADGRLNTCFNALDRWVVGGDGVEQPRPDQPALVYDSPVTGSSWSYTYRELRDEVAVFAGALTRLGVAVGDRVVIYLPMVPEAVIAMLACARLGAVHSVVFGGFAPNELAIRIDDAKPKVIVSASCGIEPGRTIEYKPLLDEAIRLARHAPESCVVLQRPQAEATLVAGRDVTWQEAIDGAEPADCVPVAATDPLYILYTSGTTGLPKGVVRDNGGHAVALDWSMANVYGVEPGDVFWAASDVGWVVGHSYIVYAPLIHGCTTVLYEGKPVGTPDAGAFWRVVEDHDVSVLFTAPTAIRAIKKEDAEGSFHAQHDTSSLQRLYLAGERTDPDTYQWATELLGVPVIDHWWQTESGWPMAANCVGVEPLPIKAGSPSRPVPGWDLAVVDDDGNAVAAGEEGAIVARLPLPPASLPTLWNDEERFVEAYFSTFEGCYLTGDGGHLDEDGYLWVMGRTDDVINVAGHRLSTGSMEEILATHPVVAECAVIGVHDDLKGQMPMGFVVVKTGTDVDEDELVAQLVGLVRARIGAVAAFKTALVIGRLPKTRSGKILRKTMRAITDGREYSVPSTIDDPAVLDEVADAVAAHRSEH